MLAQELALAKFDKFQSILLGCQTILNSPEDAIGELKDMVEEVSILLKLQYRVLFIMYMCNANSIAFFFFE